MSTESTATCSVTSDEVETDTAGAGRSTVESSLARMLGALDLFSSGTPTLTVEQIAAGLGVPKSTGYRYVQELCKAGLLIRLDRSITLGPRIIELERCIRESSPLLSAAVAAMRRLAELTGLEVSVSKLYGHSVIAVHSETIGSPLNLRYGRGRPQPINKGAGSKALVSFLPPARLRKLLTDETALSADEAEAFLAEAQAIRKAGYSRTSGELEQGKTAVAAPIFARSRVVVASITAMGTDSRMNLFKEEGIAQLVMEAAQTITDLIVADPHL